MLDESEIDDLITIGRVVEAVEKAFKAKGNSEAQMPPKSYIYFNQFNGDFRTMPAYLEKMGAAGVKVVNVHPDNPKDYDLPSAMATILLLNPKTGEPLSIMSGTRVTDMRTGAAGAVAAKYLAREDPETVGFIGTGAQARTQLVALLEVFNLKEGLAYGEPVESRENFVGDMEEKVDMELRAVESGREAVEAADIVVTTTPVRSPIVKDEWISEGTHINAIGADARGKQELEVEILKRSKIVLDDWSQASHSGEINVSISEGILSGDDIYANIGEIVTGKKKGRTSEEEITIFDSTGLAVQDVATAWRIYEKALDNDAGNEIDFNFCAESILAQKQD